MAIASMSAFTLLLAVVAVVSAAAVSPRQWDGFLRQMHPSSGLIGNEKAYNQVMAIADLDVDGDECLYCVLGLTLVDMNIDEHAETIEKILVGLCTLIDKPLRRNLCERVMSEYGVDILRVLIERDGPNAVCQKLDLCEQCSLALPGELEHKREEIEVNARRIGWLLDRHLMEPSLLAKATSEQNPVVPRRDEDGDYFSSVELSYRGAMWRGRDCNDFSSEIHPGMMDDRTGLVDNDCNGISGVDPNSGNPYEYELCDEESSRFSIAVFGDSASAAFHIPQEWLHFQNLSLVPQEAIDELDVPEQSWGTGFVDTINNRSIALLLEERNRCNHRDFQNVAKNGAKMKDLEPQTFDIGVSTRPTLGFIAYIGNDICTSSLSKMTEPDEYQRYLEEGLDALDKAVNPGSKIVLAGLADGRVLWDTMWNQTHPLGCTYAALYDFLSCTGSNPCNTWLTSNATTRNLASARAEQLSAVGLDWVESVKNGTRKYENFDMEFISFKTIMDEILANVDNPVDLIEAVDGFHPSLYAHRFEASIVFAKVLQFGFVGEPNLNNGKITQLFGDQGGF